MTKNENSQPLKRGASMCRGVLLSKMLSSVVYGAQANIFSPATIEDMEHTSPQCLLLALLYSLVAEDFLYIPHRHLWQVKKLRARHFRVCLLKDFSFSRSDIENAMALLGKLVADGTMNLPSHVTTMMTSLAKKHGISGVQLKTLMEEDLTIIQNLTYIFNNSIHSV